MLFVLISKKKIIFFGVFIRNAFVCHPNVIKNKGVYAL